MSDWKVVLSAIAWVSAILIGTAWVLMALFAPVDVEPDPIPPLASRIATPVSTVYVASTPQPFVGTPITGIVNANHLKVMTICDGYLRRWACEHHKPNAMYPQS